MSVRAGLAVLLCAIAACPRAAFSAPEGMSWQITPYAGYAFFMDPIAAPDRGEVRVKDHTQFGGSVGLQFSPALGLQVGAGFNPKRVDAPGGTVHGHADLLIGPGGGGRWNLYGLVGSGYERYGEGPTSCSSASFDAGAGLRLWVSDHFAIRAEARNVLVISRSGKFQASRDDYALVLGGLTLALGGKPRDRDRDRVPDEHDACPNTPAGAKVDARGCPTDADGDGVYDGIDQCPDTPKGATVDAKGCPSDADGDSVFDGLDQCPETPRGAVVDASGCPQDADGDGVYDGLDQCPDTPRGAIVDASGCPKDSDGDGVFDGLDKCADTPAEVKVDQDGCPIEVTERETELLDTGMIRLQDINFETAKADIRPESYPTLDVVGQVLSKWPELKIQIGGHTDGRGSSVYNQKLSEARAGAVEKYLLEKFSGLNADQFTVKGYGKSKPLAPNTSAVNMAKNRRVEFVVQNKEVLRREVERRKLLKR